MAASVRVTSGLVTVGTVFAGAPSALAGPNALTAPGCSTAVATGPALPTVGTDFVTGPEEPFGVTGAIVVYSLSSAAPTLEAVDTLATGRDGQPSAPSPGGAFPLGSP